MRAIQIGHTFVIFRKLPKKIVGTCRRKRDIIELDLSQDQNPAKTFVHEMIHLLNPKWKEGRVLQQEEAVWSQLTEDERYNIFITLFGGQNA